jgi:hypothetical protein
MAEFNNKSKGEQVRDLSENDGDEELGGGAHFNMVEPSNGASSSKMSICPECGSTISHEGGCLLCHNCGYSKC